MTGRSAAGLGARPLPGFVCIGALKAGTTFVDALLRPHPELCLPVGVKELDYFTVHHGRGPRWYAARFDGCGTRLHGEVSPRYLVDAAAPQRIAAANPDARLLLVVRDPVERAYSQYRHRVQTTVDPESFDDYLAGNPGAIDRGRYHHHVQRYLDWFDAGQLHVTLFDDLVADPRAAAAEMYRHLGVDPTHVPALPGTTPNASFSPRRRRAYARAKAASCFLHAHGQGRLVGRLAESVLVRPLRSSEVAPYVPPPSPATVRALRKEYADDVAALSSMLGNDLAARWWTARAEPAR